MKILLTGAAGSLGSVLTKLFKEQNKYELLTPSRADLDLRDFDAVTKYFDLNKPDLIIHSAGRNGWRNQITDNSTFFDNILIFDVICRCKHFETKLINFGTGGEFCREKDINNREPKSPAKDFYGASKRIITSLSSHYFGVYQLRLYGVFSADESSDRFIKNALLKYINKQPIEIFQDKYFSYFYIKDLFYLINKIIENKVGFNRLDCCYSEELRLSDIARFINTLGDYQVEIKIQNPEMGKSFLGDPNYDKLLMQHSLDRVFKFIGLGGGIREVYKELKNG